jgi:hypothetical protein
MAGRNPSGLLWGLRSNPYGPCILGWSQPFGLRLNILFPVLASLPRVAQGIAAVLHKLRLQNCCAIFQVCFHGLIPKNWGGKPGWSYFCTRCADTKILWGLQGNPYGPCILGFLLAAKKCAPILTSHFTSSFFCLFKLLFPGYTFRHS